MASTNPARGMRDFLPADVRKRNYVINIIKEVYESYGFEPLETPSVENIETLLGKYGEEGNQLVFKILKRGEKLDLANATKESDLSDLALRYDLTVPLARVVANNKNDLPKFFKRYQIQPVWRADRPARGRFREFYQCDVDAIGSVSTIVEADMMAAVCEILLKLRLNDDEANFDDFVVLANHRDILFGTLDAFEIPEIKRSQVLVIMDKGDKIGWPNVIRELTSIGLTTLQASEFIKAVFFGSTFVAESPDSRPRREIQREQNESNLAKLEELIGSSHAGQRGIKTIREFLRISTGTPSDGHIRFHPSLARGLSYYTGAIFEIGLNRNDFAGSIGGGGRYDGLIGMFGKEQIPACGFSLGLERILVVMEERGMFPPEIAESTAADVMVTIWNEDTISDSLKLAAELRKQGIRVTIYPEADKLGKQFKYADSIGIPFVTVLGDEEAKAGRVKLKNMSTGEEWMLKPAEIGSKVLK
ncbi:histidine--tRNA ligase [soil metagenome]